MAMSTALAVLVVLQWSILGYFVLVNGWYVVLLVSATLEMRRHASLARGQDRWRVLGSPLAPSVSVLAPAYNEAATVAESLRALLSLQYPNHEVVVVNDGSKDGTMDVLRREFDLVPVHPIYQRRIVTRPIRGLYRSATYPGLVVVDKENGGKADALNAGLNLATGTLICAVDADTLIEPDAIQRMVRPFLEHADVVAVGGTIRIANDCVVRGGRVVLPRVPRRPVAGFQVVEYLRAFLFGRLGWNRLGGNLIISGAFGLFDREAVVAAGGYAHDTVGEDMELVLRLRRRGYEMGVPARVSFVPDPVAWTEAPDALRVLGRQRERWQRGLADALVRHRGLAFDRRYGAMGTVAYPYFLVVELLAPVVELIGLAGLAAGLALGALNTEFALLFFLVAYGLGAVLTVFTLVMDELAFQRYTRMSDRMWLVFWALAENLGYRQLTAYWRLRGLVRYLRGRSDWGAMERRGFAPVPASRQASARPAPGARRAARTTSVLLLWLTLGAGAGAAQTAADNAWRRGDLPLAAALYAERLEADPADATALHRLALVLAWRGEHAASLVLFDRLLAAWPGSIEARVDRARVLAWSGRRVAAAAAIDSVLAAAPGCGAALRARAQLRAWAGDLTGAEADWRQAVTADPDDAAARTGLAQTLRWQGRSVPARREAARAVALAPGDGDAAREQRLLVRPAPPRIAPRLVHDVDSDGHRGTALLLEGAAPLSERVELRVLAWLRGARTAGVAGGPSPRGARIALHAELEPGWTVEVGPGIADFDAGTAAVGTGAIAVVSPRRHRLSAAAAVRRLPFDATRPTVLRRVVVDEAELDARIRPAGAWQVATGAAVARYRAGASGGTNRRLGGSLAVTRALGEAWSAGIEARAFGFAEDLDDGYFDPDVFAAGGLTGGWRRDRGDGWILSAEVGVGVQRVGAGGAVHGAFRGGLSAAREAGPGRSAGIAVNAANTRATPLAPDAPTRYRAAAVTVFGAWRP
jgi:cellulose synthase/poly-beta-1,6-N-acetylglucosamine synthase-like glycosyltransferase